MSQTDHFYGGPFFIEASLPPEALAGVRTRRILALGLDFIVVSVLSFVIWFALLIFTLGLSLVFLPPLFPLVAFFYNGLTVSGWRMATPGMSADGSRNALYRRNARALPQCCGARCLFLS